MAQTGNTIATLTFQARDEFPLANNVDGRNAYMVLLRDWIQRAFGPGGMGGAGKGYSSASAANAAPAYAEQVYVLDGQSYGTATMTFASMAAGTQVAVNGVHFLAVSGTPVTANNEFKVGVTDTADAASFVTTFNASTTLRVYGVLSATSSLGVVTFTPLIPGSVGDDMTLETLGVEASGIVTYVGPAGTQTVTINGVGVTATSGTTATNTATAVAAAINASTDPLVATFVRATSAAGVVSIYAKYPGLRGNTVTLAATGTGATAGAARLAGGLDAEWNGAQASGTLTLSTASGTVGGVINGVSVTATASGGDTATAVLIAAAINSSTNALVRGLVTATSSAAVVTVTAVRGGLSGNAITFAATGTGVTASGSGRLASGAAPLTAVLGAVAVSSSLTGGRLTGGAQNTPVTYAF